MSGVDRACELLSEALNQLQKQEGTDHDRTSAESSSASTSSNSSIVRTRQVDGSRTDRIRHEFQRLFNFSGRGGCRMDRKKRRQTFGGKTHTVATSKRSRSNVWTHEFIFLASNKESNMPSGMLRYQLDTAGFGSKTVSLHEDADAEEVHDSIVSLCEELGKTGYELLRVPVSGGKELTVIPVPSEGYSVRYLRTVLNQAKCYVRPVQSSLKLEDDCKQEVWFDLCY